MGKIFLSYHTYLTVLNNEVETNEIIKSVIQKK